MKNLYEYLIGNGKKSILTKVKNLSDIKDWNDFKEKYFANAKIKSHECTKLNVKFTEYIVSNADNFFDKVNKNIALIHDDYKSIVKPMLKELKLGPMTQNSIFCGNNKNNFLHYQTVQHNTIIGEGGYYYGDEHKIDIPLYHFGRVENFLKILDYLYNL